MSGSTLPVLLMGDIMRQYEFSIRIAQIHHLLDERKYKKALAVVRTIDLKQVKSLSDLSVIADVFAKTEQFDSAKDAYLKIYNKSKTRRILHRLIYISIRTKDIDEAERYYNEFVEMNPSSRDIITTRYRIDKAAGVPIGKLIETLEELKEEEYIEEWAYELAKLYHKAGRFEECRRECEDIKLWFGHGEIVDRAQKLIEFIDDKNALPYLDDKDYTMDKGEPNPDDTGSLPNLNEYLQKKSYTADSKINKTDMYNTSEQEMEWIEEKDLVNKQSQNFNNDRNDVNMRNPDEFIDDYDEDDFEADAGLGKLALGGLSKLTGLFRFGGKKNSSDINRNRDIQDNYTRKNDNRKESSSDSKGENANIVSTYKSDLDIKISIDNELYNRTLENKAEINRNNNLDKEQPDEVLENEVVYSQSGMGITQDLSREISAIYEAEHREQRKEKDNRISETSMTSLEETASTIEKTSAENTGEHRPPKRDATKVIERMTKAVKSDESKSMSIQPTNIDDEKETEKKKQEKARQEETRLRQEAEEKKQKEKEEAKAKAHAIEEEIKLKEAIAIEEKAKLKEAEAIAIVEEARKKAEEAQKILAEAEKKRAQVQAALLSANEESQEKEDAEEIKETEQKETDDKFEDDKDIDSEWYHDLNDEDEFYEDAEYEEDDDVSGLYNESLSEDDLPTTKALHTSFNDILTLIGGEQDPSHFVFVGDTSNLLVGLSKKIIKVMKETGYMSIGRIAKISAKKLNQMDLSGFKGQLKGNCLLIDEAAELMVPTIASVFEIMDEFYGDFVVILADDGNTLDQLFKFAPALARRFKYIIDISNYTEEDCK